jgi:hypothetical protein
LLGLCARVDTGVCDERFFLKTLCKQKEAYDLVTEYARTRRGLDDRMLDCSDEEAAAAEQCAHYEEELRGLDIRHGEALASLKDALADQVHAGRLAKISLVQKRQELQRLVEICEQELRDTSFLPEQERLEGLLATLRHQHQEIRAATEQLKLERHESVKNHALHHADRQRRSNHLLEALQVAQKNSGTWPDERQQLEAQEKTLVQTVTALLEEERFVRGQALPLEARRRLLLTMLHKIEKEPWAGAL